MQLVITSTGTDAALLGRAEMGWDGMGEPQALLCCEGMLGGAEKNGAVLLLQHF